MATPRLVELVDRYRRTHGTSESEIARRIGFSREALRKWRIHGLKGLPDRANLAAVARVIGRPYREVLSAALFDTGYLTDDQDGDPRPYDEVLADAISVLTEATRLTNHPMRQTSSGQWEADPDPRSALPIDWAAFVTDALAGAAANVGGIDRILAGRPGSWEASVVGDALRAAVGDDEWDLWRHRTEPITVDLWVEAVLDVVEDRTDGDYHDAHLELGERADAIPHPTDLPPGPFSADDPRIAAADWVTVDNDGYLVVNHHMWSGNPDEIALLEELQAEADSSRGEDTPGEIAYEAALEAISALETALDEQWKREYDDYAVALTHAIEQRLSALRVNVPVTVTITRAPEVRDSGEYERHGPVWLPDTAIERAIEDAIMNTPTPAALPGTPLERLQRSQLT